MTSVIPIGTKALQTPRASRILSGRTILKIKAGAAVAIIKNPSPSRTRVPSRRAGLPAMAPIKLPAPWIARPDNSSRRWPRRSAKAPASGPMNRPVTLKMDRTQLTWKRLRARSERIPGRTGGTFPI